MRCVIHRDEGLDLVPLFLEWRSVLGATMGNRQEFRAMLRFVATHPLRPVIDRTFPLEEVPAALHCLHAGGQFGKVVLDVAAWTKIASD